MDLVLFKSPLRPWGMPDLSPFCTKLELYLRMAAIPHTVKAASMQKAPKGKVPYVSIDGELMGDSQLILERLESGRAPALDGWLTPEQAATGRAVRRMLEEATYFAAVHQRWGSEAGFDVLLPEFRKVLPAPLRPLMPLVRNRVRAMLKAQGTGRHTPPEISAMGLADMMAVSTLLGDKPFLFGDAPSTTDCSAFAFVEGILGFPHESELRRGVAQLENLAQFRARVRKRWFSDLE